MRPLHPPLSAKYNYDHEEQRDESVKRMKPVFSHIFRDSQFSGVFKFDLYRAIGNMFSNPTVGLWYDPSDLSSMFQDSAGTIPVTAPGQPVGLRLDKSGRGNHATQATAGARLTYGIEPKTGRRNLLLATDTMATQSLTVTAAAHTLSFMGTGTVTLSGASTAGPLVGTGANNRVSLTFTPTAASLTLTVSGSVTLAQLELGSAVTQYQKVVTAFEVTESGIPTCHYCAYAGANSMATAAIDFTATDKLSFFAGVRKLSDAATAFLAETSVDSSVNIGTFQIRAPNGAAPNYLFGVRGTVAQSISVQTTYTAPISNILGYIIDLAGDINVRVDGTITNPGNGTGGGNFGNFPLFLGRRAGSIFAFTGRDYGIIMVGKSTSAEEINNVETFLANNTPNVTL